MSKRVLDTRLKVAVWNAEHPDNPMKLGDTVREGRYANVKKHVHQDGTVLDSKRELNRYAHLKLAQIAKQINSLEVHPRIPIIIKGVPIKYLIAKGTRQMFYVADFKYYDVHRGTWVLEDVKMQSGFRTEVYKIKRALVHAMGVTIEEY